MIDALVDRVALQEPGRVIVHEPDRIRAVLELAELLHTVSVVGALASTSWEQILIDS